MEAIIKFNLDEQDDVERYALYMKAEAMGHAIWEIQMNIRRKYGKYRGDTSGLTYEKAVEEIFEEIDQALADEGIDIYNLIK